MQNSYTFMHIVSEAHHLESCHFLSTNLYIAQKSDDYKHHSKCWYTNELYTRKSSLPKILLGATNYKNLTHKTLFATNSKNVENLFQPCDVMTYSYSCCTFAMIKAFLMYM